MRTPTKRLLVVSILLSLCMEVTAWSEEAEAGGVHARFDLTNPATSPFPSDLFTVPDTSQNTGLRVNLPKPDCTVRVSDCQNIDVINTLDGFNLQPRLAIPFDGPIDLESLRGLSIFLVNLGSTQANISSSGGVIALNQIVWEPTTNTLYAESNLLLEQHTRYGLIVTRAVRDSQSRSVKASHEFNRFLAGDAHLLKGNAALKEYRRQIIEAIDATQYHSRFVVAASVFTTQSATAVLEKIRDQIKAKSPAPAEFFLGPGGTHTVFPLDSISSVLFNRQTGTAPAFTPTPLAGQLLALRSIPGAIGQLAFGKYLSPDYETTAKIIPPVATASGVPEVQSENEIYFNLFLPSGTPPPHGWPVAIFGHSLNSGKEIAVYFVAADMAARGIATIAINAVGHGGGPLGSLKVEQSGRIATTFPAGGRGIDQNRDGSITSNEGFAAAPPQDIIANRDGARQTVVDLMQLVREIEVGMDVDSDSMPDLDSSRVYYFGQSLGGILGTILLAVEPNISAGVLNVPGGPGIDIFRLSPVFRPALGVALSLRIPSLINISGTTFDENMPLRDQPPRINTVPGAMDLQQFFDRQEWVTVAGNVGAYAPYLHKVSLTGMSPKKIILQFAKGDKTGPNPSTTAMIRAGDLAEQATYYRHDLAFADLLRNPTGVEVPKDPHLFLLFNGLSATPPQFNFPAVADIGRGAREQIAEFFASDGANVIDPDGPGPLFEVPIAGPLPEELNFIP